MPDPVQGPAIGRLKRRADFLRAAKGRRWHGKALSLQAGPADDPLASPRFGFTLTKKVGCAVVRNRARRRLREAVRLSPELPVKPGHDYVVIGRLAAVTLPFAALKSELSRAVDGVHGQSDGRAPRPGSSRPDRTSKRTRPDP